MENREKESKRLFINGTWVPVSDEVYKAYMQAEWREDQRRYRSWRCRDGKGVRCKKKCSECAFYRMGNGPTGSVLSIDQMMSDDEKPVDIADKNTDLELEVARNLLHEAVHKAKEQLTDREQEILDMLLDERSEREIAARLGVSNSRAHALKIALFKKLRVLLASYKDYFGS